MSDNAHDLDELISQLIDGTSSAEPDEPSDLTPLLEIARDLLDLPREEFRVSLASQLERTPTMQRTAEYIPEGLRAVTPYLLVRDAIAAIDFYKDVFDAAEIMRHEAGEHVVHAKLRIGDAVVELGEHGDRTAADVTGLPPVGVHLFVENVEAVYAKALNAGARALSGIEEQYYGDREASIADPFGIVWFVATHLPA